MSRAKAQAYAELLSLLPSVEETQVHCGDTAGCNCVTVVKDDSLAILQSTADVLHYIQRADITEELGFLAESVIMSDKPADQAAEELMHRLAA